MRIRQIRQIPTPTQIKVEVILRKYPETRNCNHKLYWRYWQEYDGLGAVIDYDLLIKLTPAESISRACRYWQNDRKMYAPNETVQEMREVQQIKNETVYGGHPGMFWK